MILCFDTETTGLPDWRNPSDAPHQPHLVQLAMILLDDDFTERAAVSLIVKPDGWVIPDEVAAIHGITTEMATRCGVSEKVATDLYVQMLYGTAAQAVAHNVDFDLRIMRIAMLRAGYDKEWQDARKPATYCTCKAATPILDLPPTPKMLAAGFNKAKTANLGECIQFFFGEKLEGAHEAMTDARACLRVFRHLTMPPLAPSVEQIGDVV